MRSQKKVKHYLIILTLSLLAIVIHGYQFATSDQEIFIPYIYKNQDKSLFLNDHIFNQISSSASLFYPIFGTIVKYIDIQSVFIISYLVFNFVFFISIYKMATVIFNDEKKAYLSLIPFFLPKFIGGTAIFTFDTFFGYRSIGVIFLIYYLVYLLKGKFKQSAFFAIVGILFHPLSIIPSLMLLPALTIIRLKKTENIRSSKYLLVGTFFLVFIFITVIILFQKNDQWLSIIKARNDYLFLSKWNWQGWAATAMYFFITLLFLNKLDKILRKKIIVIIITSVVVFVNYWFILEILKIPQIAKFQLLRSITPIAYIGLIMSPFFIFQKKTLSKIIGTIAFFSLTLNFYNIFLFFAFLFLLQVILNANTPVFPPETDLPLGGKLGMRAESSEKEKTAQIQSKSTFLFFGFFLFIYLTFHFNSILQINNKIQFPKATNDWIDAQRWSKANTQKSAKFLVPPDRTGLRSGLRSRFRTGFRIFSQRPIVGDIKDGAVVMYNQEYATYWSNLIEDLKNYNSLKENELLLLKEKYGFDYVVTESVRELNLDRVYQNNSYAIYKI